MPGGGGGAQSGAPQRYVFVRARATVGPHERPRWRQRHQVGAHIHHHIGRRLCITDLGGAAQRHVSLWCHRKPERAILVAARAMVIPHLCEAGRRCQRGLALGQVLNDDYGPQGRTAVDRVPGRALRVVSEAIEACWRHTSPRLHVVVRPAARIVVELLKLCRVQDHRLQAGHGCLLSE